MNRDRSNTSAHSMNKDKLMKELIMDEGYKN